MTEFVIDANIALAWALDEDGSNLKLQPLLTTSGLIAPNLWRLEVTNVILVRERRGKNSHEHTLRFLRALEDLDVTLMPEPIGQTLTELALFARPHQLTTYDAAYLDVAIRTGLPLLTRDNNLRAAATRIGVKLVSEVQ